MIVNDEARQAKVAAWKVRERQNEDLYQKIAKNKEEERVLLKTKKNVTGEQWGIPLAVELFEKKMARLNPNFRFEEFPPHEVAPLVAAGKWPADQPWHHKQLFIMTPEGRTRICLYPRHILPEYTVMWGKDVALPNPEYISNPEKISSPMKDFGPNWDPKKDVDWDSVPKDSPLYMYAHIPHGVALRGYREVLTICLMNGFLTLAQVEREFGSGNSAEWAQKAKGQTKEFRPW